MPRRNSAARGLRRVRRRPAPGVAPSPPARTALTDIAAERLHRPIPPAAVVYGVPVYDLRIGV